MKPALLVVLLCPLVYAGPCPTGQAKDEATLLQIEQTWARALEEQDISALMCILADEFEDAGPIGNLTGRAQILARAADHSSEHRELSEMRARIYGDVAYTRGVARAVSHARGAPPNKVRFTDVYVYREERWQCVAGHESRFPRAVN